MIFLEAIEFSKGLRVVEASRPNDSDYVFQAIREGIYKHTFITPGLITLITYFLAARHGSYLTVEDFSEVIFKLKKSLPKFKITEVSMRRVPRGYLCEDIEMFFGGLYANDHAYYCGDSCLKLTCEGVTFGKEMVGILFVKEPLVSMELTRSIWQIIYPKFFKAPIVDPII